MNGIYDKKCPQCGREMDCLEVYVDSYDPSEPYGHHQTTELLFECQHCHLQISQHDMEINENE